MTSLALSQPLSPQNASAQQGRPVADTLPDEVPVLVRLPDVSRADSQGLPRDKARPSDIRLHVPPWRHPPYILATIGAAFLLLIGTLLVGGPGEPTAPTDAIATPPTAAGQSEPKGVGRALLPVEATAGKSVRPTVVHGVAAPSVETPIAAANRGNLESHAHDLPSAQPETIGTPGVGHLTGTIEPIQLQANSGPISRKRR